MRKVKEFVENKIKTPHQKLLDLGWVYLGKLNILGSNIIQFRYPENSLILTIDLTKKEFQIYLSSFRYEEESPVISLELAKILVDYLEATK